MRADGLRGFPINRCLATAFVGDRVREVMIYR